jgi:FAD/FMN-containing dehydrogenase
VLNGWNEWQADTPDEVTSVCRLLQFPPLEAVPEPLRGNSFAVVQAAIIGGESGGADLIAPIRGLGALMDTFAQTPLEAMGALHMDPPEPVPGVSGHMLLHSLPTSAIDQLVSVAGPGTGSRLVSVELRQTGGALAGARPSSGALASVPGSLALVAVGSPSTEEEADAMRGTIAEILDALAPHDAGRLLNFVEQPYHSERAFSPDALARLRAVRAAYDPAGVMHASHPVPTG